MRPLGLTFKKEAIHIYAKRKEGELMLIHECSQCRKISLNRISGDDSSEEILSLFELSREISSEKGKELEKRGIYVCKEKDREEITAQLFGNKGSFAA